MPIFKKVKLGDIAEIASGGTPSSSNPNYWNGNINWATLPDLKNKYLFDTQRKITKLGLENSSARLLPINTIIFSSRATIGEISIAKVETSTNQGSKNLICNSSKIDFEYLYYCLKLNTNRIEQLASGATYKEINKTDLSNIEIDFPDLSTQTRISSLLSVYDDLIGNNEKRIKLLEEMAQLLYSEWFVKLKFPGHERIKMVDSKTGLGKLPQGWEVVTIESLLGKVKRKVKIQTGEYLPFGKYYVIDQGREFIAGYTNNEDAVYDKDLIVFGDHSRCFKYCNFPFACGADGTQLLLTNDSNRMPETLLYYIVLNSGLQNFNYARHFKFLKSIQVIKPDSLIAKQFDNIIGSSYSQIRILREKNIILSQIRDLLIPQLVTGRRELK